jgi:hypothetical protein
VTVNNQIVIGTLMNICDDPNRVSIGANWRESDYIKRVPIIVTGNDFSTLYAPLIRDGRMEKFYWQPQREDVVNIVWQVRHGLAAVVGFCTWPPCSGGHGEASITWQLCVL